MRIVVTGGAGFIGSAVCRLFVAELGASVLNIDKLTYAANLASLRPIENNPQPFWWWFLIGVILLLCSEVWFTRKIVKSRA